MREDVRQTKYVYGYREPAIRCFGWNRMCRISDHFLSHHALRPPFAKDANPTVTDNSMIISGDIFKGNRAYYSYGSPFNLVTYLPNEGEVCRSEAKSSRDRVDDKPERNRCEECAGFKLLFRLLSCDERVQVNLRADNCDKGEWSETESRQTYF